MSRLVVYALAVGLAGCGGAASRPAAKRASTSAASASREAPCRMEVGPVVNRTERPDRDVSARVLGAARDELRRARACDRPYKLTFAVERIRRDGAGGIGGTVRLTVTTRDGKLLGEIPESAGSSGQVDARFVDATVDDIISGATRRAAQRFAATFR